MSVIVHPIVVALANRSAARQSLNFLPISRDWRCRHAVEHIPVAPRGISLNYSLGYRFRQVFRQTRIAGTLESAVKAALADVRWANEDFQPLKRRHPNGRSSDEALRQRGVEPAAELLEWMHADTFAWLS